MTINLIYIKINKYFLNEFKHFKIYIYIHMSSLNCHSTRPAAISTLVPWSNRGDSEFTIHLSDGGLFWVHSSYQHISEESYSKHCRMIQGFEMIAVSLQSDMKESTLKPFGNTRAALQIFIEIKRPE